MYESQLASTLRTIVQGELRINEPMKNHTSFRIGGPADLYLVPASREDAESAVLFALKAGIPYFILGGGTNLLVRDEGIRGLVISLGRCLRGCRREGNRVVFEAGYGLGAASRMVARLGLGGLEFAEGIPGTVGGAVVMNAGAFGHTMSELVEDLIVMDRQGQVAEVAGSQVDFRYRGSSLKDSGWVVLQASLRFEPDEPEAIASRMREYRRKRLLQQPAGYASAGSIFKNPPGEAAGKLIESAGFKGLRCGGAAVSEVHANFIVNRGGATARDVLCLIDTIRGRIRERYGLELELEIQIVGG